MSNFTGSAHELANRLEEMARQIRNEPKADTYALKLIMHSHEVPNPTYGMAPAERRYLGKSLVVHVGVLPAAAMDAMLMARLVDECRSATDQYAKRDTK